MILMRWLCAIHLMTSRKAIWTVVRKQYPLRQREISTSVTLLRHLMRLIPFIRPPIPVCKGIVRCFGLGNYPG